jgi:uncharacterized protein (DUF4415 family)
MRHTAARIASPDKARRTDTPPDIVPSPRAYLDWRDVAYDAATRSTGKTRVTMRLDTDVLGFFRAQGPRYQTRINAVLRAYMAGVTRKESARPRLRDAEDRKMRTHQ